jgi:hypothetical protein
VSPDAFRRLALLAASSAYALGLALVLKYLGWQVFVFALVCGGGVAIAVTLEEAPRRAEPPIPPLEEGLSIREIDRRARAASGDS